MFFCSMIIDLFQEMLKIFFLTIEPLLKNVKDDFNTLLLGIAILDFVFRTYEKIYYIYMYLIQLKILLKEFF